MNHTESDHDVEITPIQKPKKKFLGSTLSLTLAIGVVVVGATTLGYTVGHRQGLTVSGYDADAEQLVEVVEVQKSQLETQEKAMNVAIQERDVAVSNSNDLYHALQQAQANYEQTQRFAALYRELLRQRGGVGLTVENLAVKPLPNNAYEYQLDLVQISPNKSHASGSIEIRLIRGSEVLVVPMENNLFDFNDYARLTGRWSMPKGFIPQFIEVRVKGNVSMTKRFSWARGDATQVQSTIVADIPQVEANAQ